MIESLLSELGSDPLVVYATLALCGIPVPVPEDVLVMTVGWSLTQSQQSILLMVFVVYAGVLTRDSICFFAGRHLGSRVFRWLGEERTARSRAWIERDGRRTIFAARFVPALRIPIFAVAGASGMSPRDFYLVDGSTILLTMTLQLSGGYFVGPQAVTFWQESPAFRACLVVVALAFLTTLLIRSRRKS